ncbi:hypothetical protein J2128_001908 [Methanomicrobium sp. W14]|uniref:hypothetical protein n=1 Tax=Methanomicrobium sp. W14 TaxID=2817839 RepID=UPI001AE2E240|nr:hypothetical protein [Methanomicrobium sp. W14]MBP2133942.1 hypothetical protein [Methanomicrobium sp. W14]
MEKSELMHILLLLVSIVGIVFVGGCTSTVDNNSPTTETPTVQSTDELSPANYTGSPSLMKVTWPQDENTALTYSDEEKQSLINEAKQEILRLLPDVDKNTLDNVSWESQ